MPTLSERIEAAQADLNAKRDRLAELANAETLDNDAIEALNGEIDNAQRTLDNLKATEQRIGTNAGVTERGMGHNGGPPLAAPNLTRRPLSQGRELSGLDLVVRAITAQGISHFGRKPLEFGRQSRRARR